MGGHHGDHFVMSGGVHGGRASRAQNFTPAPEAPPPPPIATPEASDDGSTSLDDPGCGKASKKNRTRKVSKKTDRRTEDEKERRELSENAEGKTPTGPPRNVTEEEEGSRHEAGFDLNMTPGIDSLTHMYPAAKWKH